MRSPVNPELEMKKMTLPYGGIEIEYCPESGGVWLDKGELEKLVEVVEEKAKQKYSNNNAPKFNANDNAPKFGKSDDDDYYKYNQTHSHPPYQHKKKESILGEIFDIF